MMIRIRVERRSNGKVEEVQAEKMRGKFGGRSEGK
jgi:hypothetical protein